MIRATLFLFLLVFPAMAQGDDRRTPANPGRPVIGEPRHVTRAQAEAAFRRFLPRRGILAGGGGLMSRSWRVVVDLDNRDLEGRRSDRTNMPITGPLADVVERRLSPDDAAAVERLAQRVMQDRNPEPQGVMTADSTGVLFVADGDRVLELLPPGPITVGEASALQSLLYRLAWPGD